MNYCLKDVMDEDHEWLVELHNDPLVLRNITNSQPITLDGHLEWWKSINGKKEIRKIFYVDNVRAGFCKFYNIDYINHNCVLGADLHKDYRGKHLAKPMWQLMLDFCFNELNLQRVSLTTAEYNLVARHVYYSVGFKYEGRMEKSLYRDGKYYDQICMRLLKWEYELEVFYDSTI